MNFQAYTLSKHPEWACLQVKAPESETRTPVHLCCVIDTSASMESCNKLENVKRSLQFLLDFLGPQDSISVITFSEAARTILTQTAVSLTEKDNIRTRISIIRVESNTNLSAGIIQAHESLQVDTNGSKQGILLLTDGIANMGLINSTDIIELVRNTITKFNGTSISSVGYGTDHNVELLQSISTEGGGSYYVVNNLEDVACVFGDILGGLVSCASQQVRVVLPVGTEVKSRYGTNTVGDKIEIVIGDMPAGTEAAFLAKIPSGTVATLKGYDLMTHNTYEINSPVVTTEDAVLQINGEAHYIRFEVLALIEQSRSFMSHFGTPDGLAAHILKINACIATITEYRREHEHSLWNILLEELNTCKGLLENRNLAAVDSPQIMTQHAGYLGRMRGLPALSQTPSGGYGDPQNGPLPPLPLTRAFSNSAQRHISSELCATVSGGAVNHRTTIGPTRTYDPSNTFSGTLSPNRSPNLSPLQSSYTALQLPPMPPMSPMSPMHSMLPWQLMPPMPTMPSLPRMTTGPLVRQIACDTSSRSSSFDS